MSDDSEKPFSTQIERLKEKNYHPWSTQIRALLRHQRVLDVTVESEAKPREPEATASEENKGENQSIN